MADKNPFDVELPKKSDNPFDVDIPIEKKNPVGNVSKVGTQTSNRGFEPFQNQTDTNNAIRESVNKFRSRNGDKGYFLNDVDGGNNTTIGRSKTPSVLTPKGKSEYQEQVKGYVPPNEVKQPKEEKPDFLESIKNSLSNIGTGVQQFIPNTQIALSSTLEGLLGKDLGSDFYRNIVGSTHNPELDRQEAYAKLAELEPQFKRTRGLIESAENFDAVGLAAATVDAMSSLVRTAITSVPTAGIGLASDMVGGSIAAYNQEKAKSKGISVDELYRKGENEFVVPATIGAIATGLEGIGLKGTIGLINKKLTGSFAKKFATSFVDVNKEGLTEFTQTGLDAANKALAEGKSVADASKVAVDEMFSKKGLESYLMGAVGSAGSAGLGRVVKGMLPNNKKKATEATQRIAEMESELSNPNLSPATQEFIAENIRQNVSEIADAVENDANEIEGLSDEQKFRINSINEVINSYEEVLSDLNASEQTKKLAQERISGLDLEVDNILQGKKLSPETQALVESKVPPRETPTIDTEEQIIVGGQQAQVDFEATGDQGTYEQKMKELDDRANQFIETPEVIEAPQRERGSHKIVKSEDNTTLDDMTKGGQLIPDDFYDKPQFYADINDAASKESFSVIKKAKGNPDAEITIYRAVPQGIKDIEEGDWVSLSPTYAKQHGLHPTDETQDMPVISVKVKAKDIVWDGNDVNEFAYFPISKPIKPQEDATKIREVEQGRIGEYPRATEQQQGQQEDRLNQEELITESQTTPSNRNSVVESREVEEVVPKEEFATEEEYKLDRVDKENDPEELAALYYEQESPEPDYKTEGIMDYLGSKTRINLRDWNRWNDVNNLTPQLKRRFIDSNNKSGGLDQSAMELSEMLGVEITEEDFIDAILEFGSTKAYKEKGQSKVQKSIADKYYEITGKNLTKGRAERAYLKIKNKPKTDKEIYELNESLQEIGITYEDIERYNEYAKQELEGAEKPIRKTEPVARTGRKVREEGERVQEEVKRPVEAPRVAERKGEVETARAEAKEAVNDLLDFIRKSRSNITSFADVGTFSAKIAVVFKAYAKLGIVKLKDVVAKLREDVGDDFVNNNIDLIEYSYDKFNGQTTLRNKDVALKRMDYGFGEPIEKTTITNEETLKQANKAIEDNSNIAYDVIDKALRGESLDATEMAILAQFQGIKEAELIKLNEKIAQDKDSSILAFDNAIDKRGKIIDDLVKAYDASEISGAVAGRALQARKIKVLQDYSLANMLIRVRKANDNRPLTNQQIADITDKYNKLIEAEDKYQKRIQELEEENEKLKAKQSFNRIRVESARDAREQKRARTKEVLRQERESIFEQMRKLANKGRGTLSANPIPVEMIPLIGKLAKNYFVDGVTSIEAIVDNIYNDIKDIVDGVEKRDVRDAISGYSRDSRPTKDDLQANIRDLKEQAKLISQIEDAEKGILSKNDKVRKEASDEVKKLRARLKDLTKEEVALQQLKARIKRQISETYKKIKNKDYSKKEPNIIELDDEAKKLKEAYRKIKFEFDVAVAKDQLANRTKGEKLKDLFVEIMNIPRAIMATADLSAPLRQGVLPTISNPIMAKRAFQEMLKQWVSQDRADVWLADLKDSPAYSLMQESGLYIADRNNPEIAAREEDFQTNLAEKIPIIGSGFKVGGVKLGEVNISGKKIGNIELIGRSERAYVAYLNKMRVDLFTRGVDVLQNQGMTFSQNPEAYKALANYINAATGRGSLGSLERAAPVLNTTFFSPRLIASRLQLLTNWANPNFYKNTPSSVRKMYFRDMGAFILFGLGLLTIATLAGADVEDDPRSPDFGKIRHGNTRIDVWGGFQQIVRYMAQFATGQKKSSASGKITELDGSNYNKETRITVIGNFVRSKLAPIPAFITNALYGENMVGETFKVEKDLSQMLFPLVAQGIYDSYKQDGILFAVGVTGIPSVLGIGVQTYGVNDFLKQGVDDKAIDLLLSKKAVAIEPKETIRTIYDINTGEERKMTSSEFKKYYSIWTQYIKDNLNGDYESLSKLSNEQFDDKFRSIKRSASEMAKEQVSGVSTQTLQIEVNDVKYKLTPEQVKERIEFNKEFIKEFGDDILKANIESEKLKGKSETEAEFIANKKLKSSANKYSKSKMLQKYMDNRGNISLGTE